MTSAHATTCSTAVDRGGPPAWGLVEGLTTRHRKKKESVTNPLGNSEMHTEFYWGNLRVRDVDGRIILKWI